jgi:hypothetical protein
MTKSLALGDKPQYITTGLVSAIWHGIVGGVKGGPTKGGNISRVSSSYLETWEGELN